MFKKKALPVFLNVPWGIRDVAIFIVAWFGLQLLLNIGLAVLSPHIPAVTAFLKAISDGNVAASFVLDLVGVVLGLLLVAGFIRHYGVSWQTLGWHKVGLFKTLGYLIGIMVIFLILAQVALIVVELLVPGFNANQPQTNEFTKGISTHRNLALIALVLLPPIFEETIFRGFIFPALSKRTGVIGGAILSSIIFGAAHGQPNLFVYTSILGLLLCFMYFKLRSIIPGILLHMLNNYLAFLALSSK